MVKTLKEYIGAETKQELLNYIVCINETFKHAKINNYEKCTKGHIISVLEKYFHIDDNDICLPHYYYSGGKNINIGLESNARLNIDIKKNKAEIEFY
jgi:hypothetical protein